ncbi:MAG: RluA family pseudouridine synthase [Planctomycetales bacterium]|jgi:23S rRNA pseudouridine1911/1915/1917 synthase|nr:RluA family pseudouridine synthase [Planctomycetales bacterium]
MSEFPLTTECIVEAYLSGVRIDSFLSKHLRNYTSWRINRMVTAGLAKIDDQPAAPEDRVFRGQRVSLRLVEPPDKLLDPEPILVPVVYEDPWLIVVDKPAGLVAHPVGDFQDGTLSNVLQSHLDRQTALRGLLRPGVVHRLDRMTSGLIVTAKEHLAHRLLSIDFQQGKLSKSYVALIEGRPDFETRILDFSIGQRPGGNSVLMSARADAKNARPAKTRVTVVERFDRYSMVECVLFTGRNHQIRVHLSHIGHPILGDEYYGPHGTIKQAPRFDGDDPTEERHALHAASLGFFHPILREWMQFRTSPPADFWALADSLS